MYNLIKSIRNCLEQEHMHIMVMDLYIQFMEAIVYNLLIVLIWLFIKGVIIIQDMLQDSLIMEKEHLV